MARVLHNIGNSLLSQERYPAALDYLQRAVAMSEKGSGPDHPEYAHVLANVALAVYERHRPRDLELAPGLFAPGVGDPNEGSPPRERRGDGLPRVAYVLKDRDPKQAMEYLARSLRIRDKSLAADSPVIADTLADIGEVHLRLRQPGKAKEVLQRALQLFAAREGASGSAPRAEFLMARALLGQPLGARPSRGLAEQARDGLLKAGKRKTRLYREVEAWLSSRAPAHLQM